MNLASFIGLLSATYQTFYPRSECELFIASYAGEPLAGLMAFARGSRAWYFLRSFF